MIRILMAMVACSVVTVSAEAATTWVGAQLSFPVPARDVGDTQLGVDAGMTLTQMINRHVGVGADVIQHYWPASTGFETAFDNYLRTERLESLQSPNWAMSALQITGHVKLVAPIGERYATWLQLGAGAYRLDLNLDQQSADGTYAWLEGPGLSSIKVVPGSYGGIGLDFHPSSRVALGVDGTFHYVFSHEKSTWGFAGINDFPDFAAISVGMHALFGW